MVNDNQEIGACKHGKAIHYRYPCSNCEADAATDRIYQKMRAGRTTNNGLLIDINQIISDTIELVLQRVNR